ncbi:MAG: HNH endonuclease [Desulfobacteraceae bacterium]|nr:HNH endonuclease [Desulfobacteraceae bacterium]MBC2757704.1 HNH endonuclease [Desulfobacteraceae bacterium]
MLEEFIQKLKNLRTDKNRKKWSPLTCYQAPHKPFVLLSIMDHFAQGVITKKIIEPTFDLVETFNIYWQTIMPLGTKGNMAYPFPRLQNDGIWRLIPNPGFKDRINIASIFSMKKLREVCVGARFDDELFILLSKPETREQLRFALINHYFDKDIRAAVLECGNVNIKAYEYSRTLLMLNEKANSYGNDTENKSQNKKVRDQGFRKAIVTLYEHRCALCGIRMLTPEGHTVVEAAHIIAWRESHDDSPTNGMSLCRLCHWSFDEGLMSVSKNYEVMVSKRVSTEKNFPGHVLTLSDRAIFKPEDNSFWPGQENLEWHRGKKFIRS